ncbi:hypothetical protein Poly59_15700 [Rubripirellula reticaptiva]|uniref:Uncharacterized protein n=1 Tax=Rubripirellula reticaptiva TaxID=2528013 RepID=A0A5C6F066_9BACT|nr:hypothetical protein Poly59_15700 [Rubripirellula reticaptiva]
MAVDSIADGSLSFLGGDDGTNLLMPNGERHGCGTKPTLRLEECGVCGVWAGGVRVFFPPMWWISVSSV